MYRPRYTVDKRAATCRYQQLLRKEPGWFLIIIKRQSRLSVLLSVETTQRVYLATGPNNIILIIYVDVVNGSRVV